MTSSEQPAPPSARRRATRERLLDAALAVFVEDGVQGAAVEAICARADFTRGAFYSNFDSKEQLFQALLEREFMRRADYVQSQAAAIEPRLRESCRGFTSADAAELIAEFFIFETTLAEGDATAWFVLETEFLLLAMRDPSLAPDYYQFMEGFYAGISPVVARVVAAAGRRFTLPLELAMPILGGLYQRALRSTALAGASAAGGIDDLGADLAELLFALTEEITPGD